MTSESSSVCTLTDRLICRYDLASSLEYALTSCIRWSSWSLRARYETDSIVTRYTLDPVDLERPSHTDMLVAKCLLSKGDCAIVETERTAEHVVSGRYLSGPGLLLTALRLRQGNVISRISGRTSFPNENSVAIFSWLV